MLSEPIYRFDVRRNVAAPMQDGVRLRADVYRPWVPGRFRVMVGRVGYRLRDWLMDLNTPTGEYCARRGTGQTGASLSNGGLAFERPSEAEPPDSFLVARPPMEGRIVRHEEHQRPD